MNRKLKIFIPVYLAVVVVIAAIIYIVPGIFDKANETYIAEYGTLDVGFDARCVIVRNERIHTADSAGSLKKIASEGKSMRINSRIADIGETGYYSQMRGVVSYSFDGLESELTPETMENITSEYIEVSDPDYNISRVSDEVQPGDPIFKIVDNQAWYFVSWIDEVNADKLKKDSTVRLDFGENSVQVNVYSKGRELVDGKFMVIFSCNRIYDGYLDLRFADVRVVTKSKSGILLETDSLVVQDKTVGVMKEDKYGNGKFVPVKILLQDDENTTVVEVKENSYFLDDEGKAVYTVKTYDTIIRQEKDK